MKNFILLLTLVFGLLQSSTAQTPQNQFAREHHNISPDSRNGEVLTFLTYTLIMNHELVTRVNASGNIDWTKTFDVDGQTFRPWGAVELGNDIAMIGNCGGPLNYVIYVDANGQPIWARSYSMVIKKMIVSINGNLLLAGTYLGHHNNMEYILAEIDPYNGSVINTDRTALPDYPGSWGTIKDIDHNGVWYLAIIEAAGDVLSITSDASLVPDKVFRHQSPQLGNFDIRELRRSVQGDFYVTGVDTQNDQFFCGKMSINQWFTDMRRLKISEGSFDYDLALNGPVSVESPNRVPYYHGGSWGSITAIPSNAAFNFTGILRNSAGYNRAILVQYDQNWTLNYGVLYDYNASVGQPNLVKRWNEQIVMVTTLDNGSSSRLIENRLATDFLGCFSDYVIMEEQGLEIQNEQLDHWVGEDEFTSQTHDLNYYADFPSSDPACPSNKQSEEVFEDAFQGSPITAYPNPSQGAFKLSGISGHEIAIYNLQGKLIKSYSAQDAEQILVTGLEPGVYLAKGNKKGKVQTVKVIVQ